MLRKFLHVFKKILDKFTIFFIHSYLRIIYFRKKVYISRNVKFKNVKLEGQNKINYGVSILNSKIGFGTYIASNTKLNNSFIGKYCSIGPNIQLICGIHPLSPFVSTHPIFYSTMKQNGISYVTENKFVEYKLTESGFSLEVGNDVWIGSDVKILEGLTIGDGSVIAAGSVVTKNIPPYEIWGGVPAKKIKNRFLEEQKKQLLKIKWWDCSQDKLKENIDLFYDIKDFLNNFETREEIKKRGKNGF